MSAERLPDELGRAGISATVEGAPLYDAPPSVLCNLHKVKEGFGGSRVLGAEGQP